MSEHRPCSQVPLQAQHPVVLGVQLGMISDKTFSDCLRDSDLRPLMPVDEEPASWKEAAAGPLCGEWGWAPVGGGPAARPLPCSGPAAQFSGRGGDLGA